MCGISGIIDLKKERVDETILSSMTERVAHRGPDGSALWLKHNLGLGHRLLSITGNHLPTIQPLEDESGNYIIIFNGQIFNYRELRTSLEKKGYVFSTPSDTEVVLKCYMEYGEDCNEKFNGMWAFAIVDRVRDQLFLSRDRYGHKPLYYTRRGHQFSFFSELKQLKAVPGFQFRLNETSAAQFLINGLLNSNEQTLFEDVFSILPGHSLTLDLASGKQTNRCWYAPRSDEETDMDFSEACRHFSNLLHDSINLRMPDSEPAGLFLSGGLDSSSLLSLIHNNGRKKHLGPVISCIIPYEGYNEEKYINQLSGAFGLDTLRMQPDFSRALIKDLDTCLYHQDQPITGISHLAEWLLYEEASRVGIRVMLDGQGADEILGGYPSFYYRKLWQSVSGFNYFSATKSVLLKMRRHQSSLLTEVKNLIRHHPRASRLPFASRSLHEARQWLLEDTNMPAVSGGSYGRNKLFSHLSVEQLEQELPYLLHSSDRNSMAFGIETRCPFLDHRLVDFLLTLPDDFKLKGIDSKHILRQSMKGRLPQSILQRKKMGFCTPDELLVRQLPLSWWKFDELFERFPGMFRKNVQTDVQDYLEGKRPYHYGFFRLLTFSRWASLFGVQSAITSIFQPLTTVMQLAD